MSMHLDGTPSDDLPEVLATGGATIDFAFLSFSARDPDGRDAAYIEWHSLDHRPEQYRLAALRHAMRLVSTPEARAARVASAQDWDRVDHVMAYLFADQSGMPGFNDLGAALDKAGRMPHRLPSVGYLTAQCAGKLAAPHAVAGADVIPFRPAPGVWLLVERGRQSPAALLDLPGVAGIWWFDDCPSMPPFDRPAQGLQVTLVYCEDDPLACVDAMKDALAARWASGEVTGALAAPFYQVVPFAWERYLP